MLNSVQLLRASAAWLVVFHHYIQIFYGFGSYNTGISYFLANYGSLGVDMFFVISGFVITLSAESRRITPKDFAIQRFARIVPAYWCFTAITAMILLCAPNILGGTLYEHTFLLRSLLFIPTENPSGLGVFPLLTVGWTLNFEMVFYAVFFFALFAPKKIRLPAIAACIIAIQQLLPKIGGSATFYHNPIIFEFLLGVIVAHLHRLNWFSKIPFLVAGMLVSMSIFCIAQQPSAEHTPIAIGIPCAILMAALISQEKLFKNIGFFKNLADWSYSTYLCHPMILFSMLAAQQNLGLNPTFILISTCILIAILSCACFNLIERPIQSLSKSQRTQRMDDNQTSA